MYWEKEFKNKPRSISRKMGMKKKLDGVFSKKKRINAIKLFKSISSFPSLTCFSNIYIQYFWMSFIVSRFLIWRLYFPKSAHALCFSKKNFFFLKASAISAIFSSETLVSFNITIFKGWSFFPANFKKPEATESLKLSLSCCEGRRSCNKIKKIWKELNYDEKKQKTQTSSRINWTNWNRNSKIKKKNFWNKKNH